MEFQNVGVYRPDLDSEPKIKITKKFIESFQGLPIFRKSDQEKDANGERIFPVGMSQNPTFDENELLISVDIFLLDCIKDEGDNLSLNDITIIEDNKENNFLACALWIDKDLSDAEKEELEKIKRIREELVDL